jgi:hypothetical protein
VEIVINPVMVDQKNFVYGKVYCRMKGTTLSMDKSKSAPCLKEGGIENSRAIIITESGKIN